MNLYSQLHQRVQAAPPYAWKYSDARLSSAAADIACSCMKVSDSYDVGSWGNGEAPGCHDGPSLGLALFTHVSIVRQNAVQLMTAST